MSYHYQLRHQSLLVRPWPTSPQRGAVGAEGAAEENEVAGLLDVLRAHAAKHLVN